MASQNKIQGIQNGPLTHSGVENMISDGPIDMGSAVELVTTIQPNELLPRVQETQGIIGTPLIYGIAVGGDEDGVYGSGSGTDAFARVTNLTANEVTTIAVGAGGNEYLEIPLVSFDNSGTSGTGAIAVAVLTDGKVTAINVTNGGGGYVSAPKVIIGKSPSNSTRATSKAGQTVRVLTRGKCPARAGGASIVVIDSVLSASITPGVLRTSSVNEDILAIALNSVLITDVDMIIVEVVKEGSARS